MHEGPMTDQPTPEQMKELQEKVKNMSPEELREFQKKQCVFCQIISGKIPAKEVYSDEHSFAALDINPAAPGHVLLLPKEHYSIMPQVPEHVLQHLFIAAKKISNSLLRALGAEGTNILVANGQAAGQKAQHFMIHIIPRKQKDNLPFTLPQRQISPEELTKMGDVLRKALGQPEKASNLIPPPVVEAEFEDQPIQKTSKPQEKPLKKAKKKGKKKEEKSDDVSLDDISNLF